MNEVGLELGLVTGYDNWTCFCEKTLNEVWLEHTFP